MLGLLYFIHVFDPSQNKAYTSIHLCLFYNNISIVFLKRAFFFLILLNICSLHHNAMASTKRKDEVTMQILSKTLRKSVRTRTVLGLVKLQFVNTRTFTIVIYMFQISALRSCEANYKHTTINTLLNL